ncbi:MAG: anthranilate synthase component I [Verrucomicrobia bacterium]|nr:MAG: anthranilate synthase component I [Verrucomicrobiota bacterium]
MTATAQVTPTLDEFIELAKRGNVIPVFAEFIADGETPVSAFKKLDCGGYSFLFESTEKNDVSGRFSFVGMDPRVVLQSYGCEVRIIEDGNQRRLETSSDPVDEVRNLMARYQFVSRPELPRFAGGAVGFIGYEAIHSFEPKVPFAQRDELHLPEALFMIPSALLVFDHRLRSLKIIINAFLGDSSPKKVHARAVECLDSIKRQLRQPVDLRLVPIVEDAEQPLPRSNFSREEFERAVKRAKEYIAAGDVFQVVLSQRFESPFAGESLDFYRCLRFINPSPYMFCLNFGADFSLVGSSPEMHVRLADGSVEIRPIAGTRARGLTSEQDDANAAQLLADPKERAEHVMLVDLARNDVGRVAEFSSVRVTEFMQIERYSHVMHIVSNVVGHLRAGCSAFDAVRATFPAGTVSGAPKIRAMQIISELEKTRRGCYAGAIGYFGFNGNVDSCIALRCAVLKNGSAYFQAGAGIVSDSDPRREYEETVIKARAMMKAVAMASQIRTR